MSDSFLVPIQRYRHSIEVNKSRFICTLDPVENQQQAKTLLSTIRTEFPDSNHHCWAFQIGAPKSALLGCSDDGEPHGTAGKPILNQLQHSGIGNIQAVVSRVFGGVKLGTGGLVRAYSDSVGDALEGLQTQPYINWQPFSIQFSYDLEQTVRQVLNSNQAELLASHYSDAVAFECKVDKALIAELKQQLTDISSGRLIFKLIE